MRPYEAPGHPSVELTAPPAAHEAWVIDVLVRELQLTAADIASLDPVEAEQLVHEHWPKPSDDGN